MADWIYTPSGIKPITGIKQVYNKTTVFSNGEEFEVPTPHTLCTVNMETGVARVLDSKGRETNETVNFLTSGILNEEKHEC